MTSQCYYCGQLFDTKEKLYEHLDVHTKISDQKKKTKRKAKKESQNIVDGESELSEEEVMAQFNASKTGEPARMASKS